MFKVPQQVWSLYEHRAAASDAAWLRSLNSDQRLDIYADMFRVVWEAPRESGERERLEQWRWREKLAHRRVEVDAYRKLDELCRERSTPRDAC